MNLYLNIFLKQITNLMKNGINIETDDGNVKHYFVKIFAFPVDSVARPILQNRQQFNAIHGCSWCYQQSIYKEGSMRYTFINNTPEERTHQKYLRDVEQQKKKSKQLPKNKKDKTCVKLIDNRLLNIKPPTEIHRVPRTIKNQ
ncbi:GSCOCG00010166001-RA-CDS [Cotesia congregata]|nr:GSCOCG00010166001-RA-CDS [Cotesia congregata]